MKPLKSSNSYTVSVVIPAYNAGKYISRAIDSVLSQTLKADEIIVVDDGSNDDTAEVVEGYGEQIILIRQKNSGASAARNRGIEAASGEWIAFLDADDEWLVENLELQSALLQRNEHLVWSTANFILCNCDKKRRRPSVRPDQAERARAALGENEYFDSYFAAYMVHAAGWTGTMIIKREVLLEAGLFLPGLLRMNDMDMWFRIAFRHLEIGYIEKPLAIYHTDIPESIVNKHIHEKFVCEPVDRLLDLAEEHGRAVEFEPCAAAMVSFWVGLLTQKKQGDKARFLLKRYGHLYSRYFKITAFIKTLFPRTGLLYDKMKSTIHSIFEG